jgi:UDP-N-acetylglucosamine--N-acetylmuramyl-(pentapeptide) pyrophosphoryl-undecaprenol N-acetylglucosamine transferase
VERMGDADLILSRSGATTCAELTAGGRAAVLVPFAAAADDHQRSNAKALQEAGAARMIEEKDLTGETLARELSALVDDPGRIREMEDAARSQGRPDAAARVSDLVLDETSVPATDSSPEVDRC